MILATPFEMSYVSHDSTVLPVAPPVPFNRQGTVHLDVNSNEVKQLIELIGTSGYYEQAVKNFAYMVTQMYSVLVASLLSVFVPQSCCNDVGTFKAEYGQCTPETISSQYLCSISDEVTALSTYNQFVLGWNFITLGTMLLYFYLTWSRENYILKNFVDDPLQSEIHIRTQWAKYPELFFYMNRKNKVSCIACVVGMVVQLINIIVSAKLLFVDYYAGTKTAIGFASNILIQGGFLLKAVEIAYVDYKHHLSRTILASEPHSYNVVSPEYKTK